MAVLRAARVTDRIDTDELKAALRRPSSNGADAPKARP